MVTLEELKGYLRVDFEEDDAFIMEFKVFNKNREATLADTVAAALAQIEEKQYEQVLVKKGIR